MKKFLMFSFLILALLLLTACVEDEWDDEETDTVSGDTQPSGDTGPTDPADTGDSNPADPTSDPTNPTTDPTTDPTNPTTDPATDPTTDPTNPTTDPTTDPTTPVTCTGFSIAQDSFRYEYGVYYADITDVLGSDSLKDELVIEFVGHEPEKKIYSLNYDPADPTTYNNGNYATCTECVSVFQDIQSSGSPTKRFFQESGTLTIEEIDNFHGIKGTLSAKLVEISLNSDDESVPVTNGACFEIESESEIIHFDNLCVPSCKTADGKDKICGSDGCGGICGPNNGICEGENMACSADQTQCVEYSCRQVTVKNPMTSLSSTTNQLNNGQFFYISSFQENGSETVEHDFWLRFQGASMKTTDLSTMSFLDNCKSKPFESGDPTDGWPTNNSVCLYIKNGVDFYFARKGTIVTKPNNDGNLEATLSGDIRLVQIDTGTGLDKDGGECIEITNTELNYTK